MTDHAERAPDEGRGGGGGRLRILLVLLPLLFFLGMAALFAYRMSTGVDSSEIPSVLIGTKVPQQSFAPLTGLTDADGAPVPGFTTAELEGNVSVVNVFASWCAPCRVEHPLLMDLAETPGLKMVGVNYKDDPGSALSFLADLGNPYDMVGVDPEGRNAIDWGLYGVPETFLVGPDGTIVDKVVGPVEESDLEGGFGRNMRRLLAERGAG